MSDRGVRLVDDSLLPAWLVPVVRGIEGARISDLVPWGQRPAPQIRRRSAVLMAFADGPAGPDLLLTARAATLRSHPGQPAFPGGAADAGEDAVATALREAQEETDLDPASLTAAAVLPEIFLQPSRYAVAPVLGFWHSPGPVRVVDTAETAVVARVPVAELADPARRGCIRHPSGFVGPAFDVSGMLVWGFTAGLVDLLLRLGGWDRPWDTEHSFDLDRIGLA